MSSCECVVVHTDAIGVPCQSGYCTASLVDFFTSLWHCLLFPSSGLERPITLYILLLKSESLRWPETSVNIKTQWRKTTKQRPRWTQTLHLNFLLQYECSSFFTRIKQFEKYCVLGTSQNLLTFWILILEIICFHCDCSNIC